MTRMGLPRVHRRSRIPETACAILRRARAEGFCVVSVATGASKKLEKVLDHVRGSLHVGEDLLATYHYQDGRLYVFVRIVPAAEVAELARTVADRASAVGPEELERWRSIPRRLVPDYSGGSVFLLGESRPPRPGGAASAEDYGR